jgi:hypothetical protein
MLQSPAKRRKLDSRQTIENGTSDGEVQTSTPPRRASYASPTKSSLSRSHPHLVSKNARMSESRGKSLRDEILKRPAEGMPENGQSTTQWKVATEKTDPTPARVEKSQAESTNGRPQPTDEYMAGVMSKATEPASGTKSGGKRPRPTTRTRSMSPAFSSPSILTPRLVPRRQPNPKVDARAKSSDVELPPTPVDMGLSAVPDRPRGLGSSSSPRGSKSRSGAKRRRLRDGVVVTSSPLKPKTPAPDVLEQDKKDHGRAEAGVEKEATEEAPESEREAAEDDETAQEPLASEPEESRQDAVNDEDAAELGEKRLELVSLQQQLEQLQAENTCLESVLKDDAALDNGIIALLQDAAERSKSTPDELYDEDDAMLLEHLTRFAPGNFQLRSTTDAIHDQNGPEIIHTLVLEAPSPWLPNTLTVAFKVTVDAESAHVTQVQLCETDVGTSRRSRSHNQNELSGWINARLEHPVHKFDVSGLVWAIGRWFDAAIERAKVFTWIDKKYNNTDDDADADAEYEDKSDQLDREVCIDLSRHLNTTSHIAVLPSVKPTDTTSTSTSTSRNNTRKIMLAWTIDLDWASNPKSQISISTSNIPKTAETKLKAIFAELLPKSGVKRAFEGVWDIVSGGGEEYGTVGGGKGKGRKKNRGF